MVTQLFISIQQRWGLKCLYHSEVLRIVTDTWSWWVTWVRYCIFVVHKLQVVKSLTHFSFFFPFMYSTFFSWQIVPMKYNPRDVDSIKAVMAKSNVVINLIGMSNLVQHRIQSQIPSWLCQLNFNRTRVWNKKLWIWRSKSSYGWTTCNGMHCAHIHFSSNYIDNS